MAKFVLSSEQLQNLQNMLALATLSYNIRATQLCGTSDVIANLLDFNNTISFIPSVNVQSQTISIVSQDSKTLYIAFAGTHDVDDEVSDIEFLQVRPNTENNRFVKFHDGFHAQFIALQTNITSVVKKFIKNGGTNICFVGHSSGGCVAAIAAYYLKCVCANITVVTFGSPYFTNVAGAIWFEDHCTYTRFEIDQDPVPAIPTRDIELQAYAHIEKNYIFIKNNTAFLNELHEPVSMCSFVLRVLQRRMNIYYHRTETYKSKLQKLKTI